MKRILTAICVLFCTALQAQHEISVFAKGGPSFLDYKFNKVIAETTDGKISYGLGFGYTYSLTRDSSKFIRWGISTGAELSSFTTTTRVNHLSGQSLERYSYDGRTEAMYFNSEIGNFKETQRAKYLQIPLMTEMIFRNSSRHRWYLAGGAKFGFAVSGNYETTPYSLYTSGYFPETERTFENMPEYGFVTATDPSWKGDLDFFFNIALALETGVRWAISENLRIYSGIYLDYGLTDVLSTKARNIIAYRPDTQEKLEYTSIIIAKQSSDAGYVDKINLIAVGLKVKISFWK
jgi:hypothetical protein